MEILVIAIFVVLILALTILLFLETKEHRKAVAYSTILETAANTYSEAFNSIAETVELQNKGYLAATSDHTNIAQNLEQLWAIIEVHNKALNLSPNILTRTQSETP